MLQSCCTDWESKLNPTRHRAEKTRRPAVIARKIWHEASGRRGCLRNLRASCQNRTAERIGIRNRDLSATLLKADRRPCSVGGGRSLVNDR